MDRLNESAIAELGSICPGGVARNVDLSAISSWRIGGRADLLLRPSSTHEVAALLRWFSKRGIRPVVIGLTSNLLFDDAGLRAPCIQIGARMGHVCISGTDVHAEAGVWVPELARKIMQAWLGGAEHMCGIPGTLGGLICMNGGSQRKGIESCLVEVESVDVAGHISVRMASDCGFSYRQSIFQTNNEIITAATMRFSLRARAGIRAEMLDILVDRRQKFPRKEPNCGSVFKSNPAMYAEIGPPGEAIERLGFKGKRVGQAQVSWQHANFIVNLGGARSWEVLELISKIGNGVLEATGYRIESEVSYLSPSGALLPAYHFPDDNTKT